MNTRFLTPWPAGTSPSPALRPAHAILFAVFTGCLTGCAPTLTLGGDDTSASQDGSALSRNDTGQTPMPTDDDGGTADSALPVDGVDETAGGTGTTDADTGDAGGTGTAEDNGDDTRHDSLETTGPTDSADTDPTPREPNALIGGPQLIHTRLDAASDLIETIVDAQSQDLWVFLRMGDGAQVAPADPTNSKGWDIGFQRFKIRSNGGINGSGPVRVARLEKTPLAAVTTAPRDGWLVDTATPPDPAAPAAYTFDSVFNSGGAGVRWFEYNSTDHTLRPRDVTYAIDTGRGYYAFRVLSYYDNVGSPAVVTFQWKPIGAPAP